MTRTPLLIVLAGLLSTIGSCTNNNKLRDGGNTASSQSNRSLPDRSVVLGLVRNEQVIVVTLALPNNTEAHQFDSDYQKLMNDGVLKCKYAEALSDGTPYYGDCVPGAAGSPLDSDLSMTVGYKKPSAVTGIVTTNSNSAAADLELTFEADGNNRLWQTHGDILKRIGRISPSNAFSSQAGKAFLTLYDEGWRVQRVCAVGQMSCY